MVLINKRIYNINEVRSPKFICAPCTNRLRPRPHPPHLGSYTRALLVIQDRRHLFMTPCYKPSHAIVALIIVAVYYVINISVLDRVLVRVFLLIACRRLFAH
jgi:hypothetical protein